MLDSFVDRVEERLGSRRSYGKKPGGGVELRKLGIIPWILIGVGAVVLAWWYFSDLVVVGFGRRWGRWPQVAVLPAVLALVAIDLVAYGEIWDLRLAWGVFLFTEFVFGFFAISFFLATAFAVPG